MNATKMAPEAIEQLADRVSRMNSRLHAWDTVMVAGDTGFVRAVSDELSACADTDDMTPLFLAKAIRRVAETY